MNKQKAILKIVFLILLFTNRALPQEIGSQKSIQDVLTSAIKATEPLEYICNLDVFKYFKLDQYDTELKKKLFKEKQEYRDHLNELKKLKSEMFKNTYYISEDYYPKEYDLKRKGFAIKLKAKTELPRNSKYIEPESDSVGIDYCLQLKALPTKLVLVYKITKEYDYEFFVNINESVGLEIEENDCMIYYLFTPSSKSIFKKEAYPHELYNATLITANNVRVIIANASTGKVYFDKNYKYTLPKTKK